jgi:hypothetical protein
VPWRVPNQNVGGACCDGFMTKRHRRGGQGSQRSLIPIPTTGPSGDPQKISNRYTEEVRWLERVVRGSDPARGGTLRGVSTTDREKGQR